MDSFIFWGFKIPFVIIANAGAISLMIMMLKEAWRN